MKTPQEQLNNLSDIRNLMERSSRFLSLSGQSGISAGVIALIGAAIAYFFLGYNEKSFDWLNSYGHPLYQNSQSMLYLLLLDALITLTLAILFGIYFTTRRTRKKDLPLWDHAVKMFLVNLSVPLFTGGFFCLILVWKGLVFLIAPVSLVFYGLSLFGASKFTHNEIRYLGFFEIVLGLLGCLWIRYGLIFWTIGFGVLHIVYGSVMYYRYER
jgi:hypothetical protein